MKWEGDMGKESLLVACGDDKESEPEDRKEGALGYNNLIDIFTQSQFYKGTIMIGMDVRNSTSSPLLFVTDLNHVYTRIAILCLFRRQ